MRGQVLGVDARTGEGVVTGDDGVRYRFTQDDWAHRGQPAIGMQVDFEVQDKRALCLFPVPGTAPTTLMAEQRQPARVVHNDRNKYVAAALAFFLGVFGVHRFYTGRTGTAIVMIVLTCTLIGVVVTGLWAFIDMIRYLVMSDEEFAERYARR